MHAFPQYSNELHPNHGLPRVNSLAKLLDREEDNLNEATSIFNDVLKTWNNVETKHYNYIISLEDDTVEGDAWIEEEKETTKFY